MNERAGHEGGAYDIKLGPASLDAGREQRVHRSAIARLQQNARRGQIKRCGSTHRIAEINRAGNFPGAGTALDQQVFRGEIAVQQDRGAEASANPCRAR